jgi:hypothetical protein
MLSFSLPGFENFVAIVRTDEQNFIIDHLLLIVAENVFNPLVFSFFLLLFSRCKAEQTL